MSNLKKYNIFVFITSFSKLLIELFIPLILYDKGFTVKEIIIFLILKSLFSLLVIPLILFLGRKYLYSKVLLVSSILFTLTYVFLNYVKSFFSLVFLSFIYGLYLSFYWIPRHIYASSIIEDKKATDNVSLYSIFGILGGLPASYIGAKVMEQFGFNFLIILVTILMFISVFFVTRIKDTNLDKSTNLKNVITNFKIRNFLFLIFDNFRYISVNLFPLYIYLNISKSFRFLGIINIIIGIGSIIYIYIISKVMDKKKKNYLSLSCILLGIIFTLKINVSSKNLFLLVIFFEGIIKSSLDAITLRNMYVYSKEFTLDLYISYVEVINNLSRVIILLMLLSFSLKGIIIICILGIFITSIIKFDDGKYGYNGI